MVEVGPWGALSKADSRDPAPVNIAPGHCGDVAAGVLKEEGSVSRVVAVVVDIEVDIVKSAKTALASGWLSEILSGDPQVVDKIMSIRPSGIGGPGVDGSGRIANNVTHKQENNLNSC